MAATATPPAPETTLVTGRCAPFAAGATRRPQQCALLRPRQMVAGGHRLAVSSRYRRRRGAVYAQVSRSSIYIHTHPKLPIQVGDADYILHAHGTAKLTGLELNYILIPAFFSHFFRPVCFAQNAGRFSLATNSELQVMHDSIGLDDA
jgi:hypothetical protein